MKKKITRQHLNILTPLRILVYLFVAFFLGILLTIILNTDLSSSIKSYENSYYINKIERRMASLEHNIKSTVFDTESLAYEIISHDANKESEQSSSELRLSQKNDNKHDSSSNMNGTLHLILNPYIPPAKNFHYKLKSNKLLQLLSNIAIKTKGSYIPYNNIYNTSIHTKGYYYKYDHTELNNIDKCKVRHIN